MKVLLKYLLVMGLVLTTNAYAYTCEKIEFYNDPLEACCVNHFEGFYAGVNVGRSWLNFFLHRPAEDDLFPLNRPQWKLKEWAAVLALGYDLFPRRRIPLRFEVNLSYFDDHFTNDPLFVEPANQELFAHDDFRIYNAMATLYFDMHTCSRFVPFVGLSGGYALIDTGHQPKSHVTPEQEVFSNEDHAFTWGGTIGTRFFITCHLVANLQYRFNDLKELEFRNSRDKSLPDGRDYSSDYFHESTVLFGLAYQF